MATASKDKTGEAEQLNVLPVNHPEAGYVSADLSYHTPYAAIPEEEAEWHRARNEAREEEVEKVKKHEDEVFTKEQEERDKRAEEAEKRRDETQKLQDALLGAISGVAVPVPATSSKSTPGTATTSKS